MIYLLPTPHPRSSHLIDLVLPTSASPMLSPPPYPSQTEKLGRGANRSPHSHIWIALHVLCSWDNTFPSAATSVNRQTPTHSLTLTSGVMSSRKPSLMAQPELCVPTVHSACLQPSTLPTGLYMFANLFPLTARKLLQSRDPFLCPRAQHTGGAK